MHSENRKRVMLQRKRHYVLARFGWWFKYLINCQTDLAASQFDQRKNEYKSYGKNSSLKPCNLTPDDVIIVLHDCHRLSVVL